MAWNPIVGDKCEPSRVTGGANAEVIARLHGDAECRFRDSVLGGVRDDRPAGIDENSCGRIAPIVEPERAVGVDHAVGARIVRVKGLKVDEFAGTARG